MPEFRRTEDSTFRPLAVACLFVAGLGAAALLLMRKKKGGAA